MEYGDILAAQKKNDNQDHFLSLNKMIIDSDYVFRALNQAYNLS